ncbi:MAG: hypothetical protein SW019_17785 [Actinomycetota bacterium]|nr:hypothetical protein [Actinomycetota bacterium]
MTRTVMMAAALVAPVLGLGAGTAAATPISSCDGAGCVPYVDHSAQLGASCNQAPRYNFGMDSSGQTLACNFAGQWVSSGPLTGVRTLRSQCTETGAIAQSPDGVPLQCDGTAWSADYSVIYYS